MKNIEYGSISAYFFLVFRENIRIFVAVGERVFSFFVLFAVNTRSEKTFIRSRFIIF